MTKRLLLLSAFAVSSFWVFAAFLANGCGSPGNHALKLANTSSTNSTPPNPNSPNPTPFPIPPPRLPTPPKPTPPPNPIPLLKGIVVTYHNDNQRTGQNQGEAVLTPQNVNSTSFGKLFSYPVDGAIYGQPLFVQNLEFPTQGIRNVVYVVTQHDSVYAFDGDQKSPGTLWQVSLADAASNATSVPCGDETACGFIGTEIGITSTPVIDIETKTLYVCALTKENGTYVYRLHALDLVSGSEKFGGPVTIQGSVSGTGAGGDGTNVAFDAHQHLQRSALLLNHGVVYIAFASFDDTPPFHGWIFGYNSQTLQQRAMLNLSPNGSDGGIWESGGGLASDTAGSLYLVTGNGTFDADSGGQDYGDSFIRLTQGYSSLAVADFFTPYNQLHLDMGDADLGSGGPVLLPDQSGSHAHLMLGAGKQGILFLVDRDNMGHFHPTDNNQVVQSVQMGGGIFSTPAFWVNKLYVVGVRDSLKSYDLNGGVLSTAPTSQSANTFGFPGATPSISANGSNAGIVWVVENAAFRTSKPAVLHAFDATDVSKELYNSQQAGSRDMVPAGVGFVGPTVANGKVYVGTVSELAVFGVMQ